MGKLISKPFNVSKVSSHKVLSDSAGKGLGSFGKNTHKLDHGFKSGTKSVKMNGK
jgi:hypothetical protein